MKAITFSLLVALVALVALAFVRPVHPTGFETYISVKGTKQGQFKGESKGKGGREDKGWFRIQSFDLAGEVPVDAFRPGAASGKRTHKPISITKEMDAASPLLLQAHVNNETLATVVIEMVGRPASGVGEIVTRTITLTNAVISDIRKSGTIEAISFTYEKVESQQ